jgi:hypothetical protein
MPQGQGLTPEGLKAATPMNFKLAATPGTVNNQPAVKTWQHYRTPPAKMVVKSPTLWCSEVSTHLLQLQLASWQPHVA